MFFNIMYQVRNVIIDNKALGETYLDIFRPAETIDNSNYVAFNDIMQCVPYSGLCRGQVEGIFYANEPQIPEF